MISRIINKVKTIISQKHIDLILKRNHINHTSYFCNGLPYIDIMEGCIITLGKNFTMNNGLSGNQIGFNTPCIFRCENGNITIGENVGISQSTLIAKCADITIGNNVKLGGGVKLYTSDFHSLNYEYRRVWTNDREHRNSAPIILEDDSFIGAGSIILKGVTVGARSIVGAGSVVTKSIPSDEIWAGNPARFIKKLTK